MPNQGFFGIGFGMVAPTMLAHGTPEVHAYLPRMYPGELVGCQLFSEPGAGSDLAGLTTKAERDGDEWVITGQKVWTSGAHYSDIGEIICRTDPDLPKHKGLTGFMVDMHAPGVEVRPLRQMTGGAAFNEVFFDEVRVPDNHRLGDVNMGWTVALTTLMNERASIGGGGGGGGLGLASATRLIEMMQPLRRERTTRCCATSWPGSTPASRWPSSRTMRAAEKLKATGVPGPELSIGKLMLTNNLTATAEFVAKVLGPRLIADTGEWGTYAWSHVRLRHARHAHRRRLRRDAPQHHRRAGARPPQGARHRLQEPLQGPAALLNPTKRQARSSAGQKRIRVRKGFVTPDVMQ